MDVRNQIIFLAADMIKTLADPTQAVDIAVADFNFQATEILTT